MDEDDHYYHDDTHYYHDDTHFKRNNLKYLNTMITFREVPDKISLCINITGCRNFCIGCHSPELWTDIGTPLTDDTLKDLIKGYKDEVEVICFMGGDHNYQEVFRLAQIARNEGFLTCWYSGLDKIVGHDNLDYLKIGSWRGRVLGSPDGNQHFYKVEGNLLVDLTDKFAQPHFYEGMLPQTQHFYEGINNI